MRSGKWTPCVSRGLCISRVFGFFWKVGRSLTAAASRGAGPSKTGPSTSALFPKKGWLPRDGRAGPSGSVEVGAGTDGATDAGGCLGRMSGKKRTSKSLEEQPPCPPRRRPLAMEPASLTVFTCADAGARQAGRSPGHTPSPRLAATDTPPQPSSSGGQTPSRSSHRSKKGEGAAAGALTRPGAAQSPVPPPACPATSCVPRCTTSATGLASAWLPGPSSSRELLLFQLIMSHGLT